MADMAADRESLRRLIDRMTTAREAMNVHRDLLAECRREARSDGLNSEALNPLIDILCENRHDRGSRTLNDLIDYARAAGADAGHPPGSTQPIENPAGMAGKDAEGPVPAAAQSDIVVASTAPLSRHRAWRRDAVRITLALLVAIALIWLLN